MIFICFQRLIVQIRSHQPMGMLNDMEKERWLDVISRKKMYGKSHVTRTSGSGTPEIALRVGRRFQMDDKRISMLNLVNEYHFSSHFPLLILRIWDFLILFVFSYSGKLWYRWPHLSKPRYRMHKMIYHYRWKKLTKHIGVNHSIIS